MLYLGKIRLKFLVMTVMFGFISAKGSDNDFRTNRIKLKNNHAEKKNSNFLQRNFTRIKAQTGSTASIPCALKTPLQGEIVSWVRRHDYHLLTVGRQIYSSDKRMGVKVSADDWILTIRWVTTNDAGFYECQVSSHPPQSLIVKLNVVHAHAEILGMTERHIHNGSSLRLVCIIRKATEVPVYVFWYRDQRMINYDREDGVEVDNKRDSSVLFIESVDEADRGNYSCVPSNARPAYVIVHIIYQEKRAVLERKESNNSVSAMKSEWNETSLNYTSPTVVKLQKEIKDTSFEETLIKKSLKKKNKNSKSSTRNSNLEKNSLTKESSKGQNIKSVNAITILSVFFVIFCKKFGANVHCSAY